MYANPHSSDAHGPKQMTAVSTACRPRHRQSPNSEERSTLLTTLLGIHTMDRRHCEAARRQQACDRWGSLLRSHARRGRKVWAKAATTPLACASARSPGTGGCQKRAALAVFIPLPKCGVPPHTEYKMRKIKVCVEIRTHVWCVKKLSSYLLDQKVRHTWLLHEDIKNEVLTEARVVRVL